MRPLEPDGAPGEEPMWPLEQVGPLKQEFIGPFGDNDGPLELAGAPNVKSKKFYGPKMFHQ